MNWLSCREVLEKETLRRDSGKRPGFLTWMGMIFHLAVCRTCRLYLRQVSSLKVLVHRLSPGGFDENAQIRQEKKDRILEALRKEASSCGCQQHAQPAEKSSPQS